VGRVFPDAPLSMNLQCECLTKSSNTPAFSHLSLRVLFLTNITFLAMNNDDGSNLE